MNNEQLSQIKQVERELTNSVIAKFNIDYNKRLENQNINDEVLKQFDTEHIDINLKEIDDPVYSYMGFRTLGNSIKLYYIRKIYNFEHKFEIPNNLEKCGERLSYMDGTPIQYAYRGHLEEIFNCMANIRIE